MGFLLLLVVGRALGKTVSGDFRLSGLKSDYLLTSFAVVPEGARVQLTMTASSIYEQERFLKLRLYKDTEWAKFQGLQTCTDKIRLAQQSLQVGFDWTESQWKTEVMQALIINSRDGETNRPHYWYVVVDDCSLEQVMHDSTIPTIHYELEIQNNVVSRNGMDRTHLSADELSITMLHTATMILSGIVAFLLLMNVLLQLRSRGSIHAALAWVAVTAALDSLSSLCEILHTKIYEKNGVGSYSLDALSAHFEALCDSQMVVLLLFVAAGWTLPSHVLTVNPNQSPVQRLLSDLSKPTATPLLAVSALHMILAQWGRTYNDDFESYHDLEHAPGKILMLTRVVLGVLFLAATLQTRLKCTSAQLRSFYDKLAVLGFCWFQSLPALVFFCNSMVPYYLRHPAVVSGSALLQTGCVSLLALLVTSHSSLHHFSMTKEESMAENLMSDAPSKSWKIAGAKVRLD